jgi:hypothetical protein
MLTAANIASHMWLVGGILLIVTIALLYKRGLHRDFPWFFRYLLLVLVRSPILFAIRMMDSTAYFYTYWILEAVTVAVSFLVIFEVYRHVLRSSTLNIRPSTFFTLCVGLFAAAAATALVIEVTDGPALLRAIFVLTRTVRIMQVCLFVLLLIGSLFFNFYWQSVPFGVALGYGIYATTEMLVATFRSSLGPAGDLIFAVTKVFSYQVAVLIWILYIYRHREHHALQTLPAESLSEWMGPLEGSAE